MTDLHDLELLLNADHPLVFIESREETRLLERIVGIGKRNRRPVFRWSATEGMVRAETPSTPMLNTQAPDGALRHIRTTPVAGLYVLLDFHPYLSDPLIVRYVKEIAQDHADNLRTLVLISHAIESPQEVRHLATRFVVALPDRPALKGLIRDEIRRWQGRHPGRLPRVDPEAAQRLAHNLGGVSVTDARRLVRKAIEDDGAISASDVPAVMQAKHALINRGGLVSFEYDIPDFAAVAGLDRFKAWLVQRAGAFRGEEPGLDPPKGVLLLGVQGAGKSLAAKGVAGEFGLPLLRLDFAVLYDKYIGETERNLRESLAIADTMAPCVLWVDEIEKGLGAAEGEQGVSRRVLGTLLNWMAERRTRVFVVATANDISALPPELIRKGRFDEIFFVDLPGETARREIFRIHLEGRGQSVEAFDLDRLAAASEGFSGAEIEQAVVAALYAAHPRGEGLDTDLVLQEIDRTSPLALVMSEQVAWLRGWAAGRAVPAH